MSLILEALRRSEAERKRGKAPSLLDGAPTPRPRERPLWPIAAAGLALGLLIAAGVAWWMQRGAPVAVPTPTPTPTPTPVPMQASAPIPEAAPRAAGAPTAIQTPASKPEPVSAPAPAKDVAPLPPPAPVVAATPTPTVPPSTASPTPAAPTPPTPATAPSASITDPLLGPATGDLPINELPTSTRAALPPLRLSMHVFNDDPAQRFAIVDGTRLREGDALDDAQVIEIRRDGLRLAWQGRTLWLPR